MSSVHPTSTLAAATSAWAGPLRIHAVEQGRLETWAAAHRRAIEDALLEYGAILFKGFGIDSAERFGEAAASLTERLLEYVYRSTPRTMLAHNVYTATEYPAHMTIPMHNENAYQREWPMRLAFCCVQPAESGGQTLLASSAQVTARIEPIVMKTFSDRQVMYVRNYGHGIDLPWETVFQTASRTEVERFCQREGIAWEWLPEGRLRTRQVCQAVARHPMTGEQLWFNQAHLFHVSSLGEDSRRAMLDIFDEADLPRHACFGDGTPIDEAMLDHVRAAYQAETIGFPWERGDLLLVDNMLVAHGRSPFTGARKVLVAMGTPYRPD